MTDAKTFATAEAIVNSRPVLSVYAACQWEELSDDGKQWIATIVAAAQSPVSFALSLSDLINKASCLLEVLSSCLDPAKDHGDKIASELWELHAELEVAEACLSARVSE